MPLMPLLLHMFYVEYRSGSMQLPPFLPRLPLVCRHAYAMPRCLRAAAADTLPLIRCAPDACRCRAMPPLIATPPIMISLLAASSDAFAIRPPYAIDRHAAAYFCHATYHCFYAMPFSAVYLALTPLFLLYAIIYCRAAYCFRFRTAPRLLYVILNGTASRLPPRHYYFYAFFEMIRRLRDSLRRWRRRCRLLLRCRCFQLSRALRRRLVDGLCHMIRGATFSAAMPPP